MSNKPNSEFSNLIPADSNLEVIDLKDLKIVGSEEFERIWKSTVRERRKIQEKKIWDDFCKNEDIQNSVFKNDPYQFLGSTEIIAGEDLTPVDKINEPDQPPSVVIEDNDVETHYASGDTGDPLLDTQLYRDNNFIPFIKDSKHKKAASLLNVDLDESQEIDSSLEHGQSPCTVRETTEQREGNGNFADAADEPLPPEKEEHGKEITFSNVESCEDVAPVKSPKIKDKHLFNIFQSSVYYEKVRDLRIKINELLQCLIELFINETNHDCDVIELRKLRKRADEFSRRFNRIYIYQLQRQLNDIKRHMSVSLPFGKRTQFQAQTTRVTSLHQNTFQALMMLQHPLQKSLFLGEGGQPLQALLQLIQEATDVCCKVVPSHDLTTKVHELYNDTILYSCENLEQLVKQHSKGIEILIETEDLSPQTSRRKTPSNRQTQRKLPPLPYQRKQMKRDRSPKYGLSSSSRLSLYSVDKLRLNLKPSSKYSNSSSIRLDKESYRPGGASSKIYARKSTTGSEKQLKGPTKRNDNKFTKNEGNQMKNSQLGSGSKSHTSSSTYKRKTPTMKNIHEEEIETMVEMESVQNKLPTNTQSQKISSVSAPFTPKAAKYQVDVPPTTTERPTASASASAAAAAAAAAAVTTPTPGRSARARAAAGSCDVSALLRRLCGGKTAEPVAECPVRPNRVTSLSGASNAQLICVTHHSPPPHVAPSTPTPHLLKILEEHIQKQPLQTTEKRSKHTERASDSEEKSSEKVTIPDKLLFHFNLQDRAIEDSTGYRRQFIEYMMSSPMYVNSAYNNPWQVVERVTDKVIEELLVNSALEMQLERVLLDLCRVELNN